MEHRKNKFKPRVTFYKQKHLRSTIGCLEMKKKEREGSGMRQEESLQQVFDSNENSIHDVYVSTPSLPDAWHLFPKDDPQQQRKLEG